jgi:tetratricopeptide (TPR) repeat protein
MISALALAISLSGREPFERGMADLFAYARNAAAAQFETAAAADPHLAIAYWGQALALGSDLNTPLTPESFAAAQQAIAKGVALEAFAPSEQVALIEAVRARYAGSFADATRDDDAYRTSMEAYVQAHPEDDDATMLLVEDLLERGSVAFDDDGSPLGTTSAQAVALTQRVLARSPLHLLANHLCIHLYDRAPNPSPAIPCAQRLDAMTFAPEQEHLAHMPAHVWIELGDGRRADASSERAWALHPTRYAEHDAYVALSAAMLDGDAAAIAVWSDRLGAVQGQPVDLAPPPYARDAQQLERQKHYDAALEVLRREAVREGASAEMLPFYPAGVRIGALLYRLRRYDQARDAFLAVLAHRPRDPRALFGLALAQRALADDGDAALTQARFERAWAGGALTIADF